MKPIKKLNIILDIIFFPLRAFFMLEKGFFYLSSLRDERMYVVKRFCKGRVLDIGCGPHNLFIKNFIGEENGIGIDVYPYPGVDNVVADILNLPFNDETFDTVTLIAVGGHIPKEVRKKEFAEIARVIKNEGLLIFTEGEPITQYIVHKWSIIFNFLIGQKDVDEERGMEEEEEYCMPSKDIHYYLNSFGLNIIKVHKFMWGLNNVYISKKISDEKN